MNVPIEAEEALGNPFKEDGLGQHAPLSFRLS